MRTVFLVLNLSLACAFLALFLTDPIASGSKFQATDDYQFASGVKSQA
jgi:hypothetical protein